MRILVVCQHYHPEPFRISDICKTLVQMGNEVTVVTGLPNYPEGEIYPGYEHRNNTDEWIDGVRVHRCFTIPRKKGVVYRLLNYYSFAWSSSWYLSRVKEDFDVVFVNQLSPVMMAEGAIKYAKKNRKRMVLYCLDLWPESLTAGGVRKGSLIYRLFRRISKRIYKRADQILITSRGFLPYLRDYLAVPGEYEYLPQYAEMLFDDIPEYQPHSGPYHIVFAGNIGEVQSVETIIGAARLLKDETRVIFDIVGDGSATESCKKLAEGLPNVVFHGRRPVDEMPQFYSKADAMLVTLKDSPEISVTLPGKMQSYMAAGRMLLGSIAGEAAEVISDAKCGLCAAPEDAAALADNIRYLVDHPKQISDYAKNSKEYYNRYFKKDIFMKKLVSVLEKNVTGNM